MFGGLRSSRWSAALEKLLIVGWTVCLIPAKKNFFTTTDQLGGGVWGFGSETLVAVLQSTAPKLDVT